MADQPEKFEEAYLRFVLRGMFWTMVVLIICAAVVICTSIYSAERRRADIETAEYAARSAEALADQQRNEVMVLMKQIEAMREQNEKETRQQIGGESTKKKGKK